MQRKKEEEEKKAQIEAKRLMEEEKKKQREEEKRVRDEEKKVRDEEKRKREDEKKKKAQVKKKKKLSRSLFLLKCIKFSLNYDLLHYSPKLRFQKLHPLWKKYSSLQNPPYSLRFILKIM